MADRPKAPELTPGIREAIHPSHHSCEWSNSSRQDRGMFMASAKNKRPGNSAVRRRGITKKEQIIALFLSGITKIEDLARMTNARPSYVATVLQNAGLLHGYFDLYTSTAHPMNVYAKRFAGKLGFKDEATARRSIAVLDRFYRQFARDKDRAGQHHALSMALIMFDRARWTGMLRAADLFRQWLVAHLTLESSTTEVDTAPPPILVRDSQSGEP
jgi:hypothetical protein